MQTKSKTVSIKDGAILYSDIWTISPEVELDEFVPQRFNGEKDVSFISDIDTITFTVKPNKIYDFSIIHNNKKAHTRINTDTLKQVSITPEKTIEYHYQDKNKQSLADTIPFKIGKDNRIYIKASINNSQNLNVIFDTGANAFAVKASILNKKVKMNMDSEVLNSGSDGASMKQRSSKNTLQIKDLIWDDIPFTAIDYKDYEFDAVLGWVAFQNKVIEINYDKQLIIVRKSLQKIPEEYQKIDTDWIRGLPYIKGVLEVNNKTYEGWLEYDSGYSGTLKLSQEFASKNYLTNLKEIGISKSSGSEGILWKTKKHKFKQLNIGSFVISNLTLFISDKDPKGILNNDILGNNILKRFNAIIDLNNFQIYLKPNRHYNSDF
ncbi:aspartyl protease family protein [Polaribacter porphyrae]|uniref:aspartyl protease family protein n=1 Tax=Polaribacter porphyrae TaxID=1137780 RepID=UPI001CFFE11A|nr:aspartyl protease family protein [Polaribacter porphyrae]